MKVILLRQPLVYLRSALIGFSPPEAKVVSHSGLFNNIRKGWHKRRGGGVLRVERAEKGNTVFL